MIWPLMVIVVLTGLCLSGFFSGAETGLYRINRLRLELGVQERKKRAINLARILEDEQGALSVALIGTNIANFVTTSAVAYVIAELVGVHATATELYTVALVTPVVFVFGEMVPKNLFRLHADVLMMRGSSLLLLADRLFRLTGLVWVLTRLAGAAGRFAGAHAARDVLTPKRRVAEMLQEALADSLLFEEHSDLIDRVCRLSETPVLSVMVPRNRVRVIAADADRRELFRIARSTRHGRLPVYESSPNRIVGIVKVDALLEDDRWVTVGDQMRRPITLHPHETVANAMAKLQKAGRGMAVVTDRGGQMLGIVTLKDLLQEAVGELAPGV